jgi:hypothetical protein
MAGRAVGAVKKPASFHTGRRVAVLRKRSGRDDERQNKSDSDHTTGISVYQPSSSDDPRGLPDV